MFFPYVFSKSDDIFSKSSFMFHSYNFVPYFHIKRADIAVPLPIIAYIPITLYSLIHLCFIYLFFGTETGSQFLDQERNPGLGNESVKS